MKIKIILIDLGGVYFENGTKITTEKLYKSINKPKKIIDEVFKSRPLREGFLYRKGKMSKQEFWRVAVEKLGLSKDKVPELRELWFSSYTPIQKTKDVVLKLKENYKIVACSGHMKERIDYLDNKYDFKESFDDFFLSHEIGFHKWEPHFWKILAKKYNPKESIFIDDEQRFFDFAQKQGFKTIIFENPKQLISDLKNLGIKI